MEELEEGNASCILINLIAALGTEHLSKHKNCIQNININYEQQKRNLNDKCATCNEKILGDFINYWNVYPFPCLENEKFPHNLILMTCSSECNNLLLDL